MIGIKLIAAGAALAMFSLPATAATVFSEDFSGATPGNYNSGPIAGTHVSATGNVDIVGEKNGSFFACVANPGGNCVDLVGGNGAGSGIVSNAFGVVAGTTYAISFSDILQGFSAGDPQTSLFTVSLGGFSQQLTSIAGVATSRTLSFVAAATLPTAALSFVVNTAPDGSHGPVVQNIVVNATAPSGTSAAPEPATWAMMVAGFGLIGAGLRRRPSRVRFA